MMAKGGGRLPFALAGKDLMGSSASEAVDVMNMNATNQQQIICLAGFSISAGIENGII